MSSLRDTLLLVAEQKDHEHSRSGEGLGGVDGEAATIMQCVLYYYII